MSTKRSFSGQDLADLTGVEGITFRRYIRSDGTRVGRGKKYSFDADTASLLIQGFLTGKSGTVEEPVIDEDTKEPVLNDAGEPETVLRKVEKLTEEQAEQVAKALIASEIEDDETEDSTEDETEEPQGSTEDTETEDSDEETEDEDTEDES